MFRNYFISALRNMIRNKVQTLIQVISLSTGITAAILIGLFAIYELSYDKFNQHFDRIYRLEFGDQVGLWAAPGHEIKQNIPEVENVVRLAAWWGQDETHGIMIPATDSTEEKFIELEDVLICDSTFFEVFSFDFLIGDPEAALKEPYTAVLSRSAARIIFGDRDPLGKTLCFADLRQQRMTVTGVFKDLKNSHVEVNLLTTFDNDSYHGFKRGEPGYLNDWSPDLSFMTYVLLPEQNNRDFAEERINDVILKRMERDLNMDLDTAGNRTKYHLRPLKDVYFSPVLSDENNYCRHGNRKLLAVFLTIAVFILLLGIINYINLTTARASLRAREIAIRIVTGATPLQLVLQFLSEAILMSLISMIIALTLVQLLFPGFNNLASTNMDLSILDAKVSVVIFVLSALVLGVLSGLYPAWYLTLLRPVASLSWKQMKVSGSVTLRRALLSFQFTISIILIIGVLITLKQLHYMKTTDLGFDKDLVINLDLGGIYENIHAWDLSKQQLIRHQVMEDPKIIGITFSDRKFGKTSGWQEWEINGTKRQVRLAQIDPDYFEVMGIPMVDGRNFSWDRPVDDPQRTGAIRNIIINETFVREFGIESPVGSNLFEEYGGGVQIIGVVSDYHDRSLHEKIEPLWYYMGPYRAKITIKISQVNVQSTIDHIKKVLGSIYPGVYFKYSFLDERIARQYIRDEKTARIIVSFAIVAIIIACLGLFGLSSFMAARRTKEIGIRKSMGASVQSVFRLLSREFLKWVGLSIVIACPVGWIIMDRWLQNFAYRTGISWWIFVLTILIALVITFATVTWQSLKTARTNPVESLRYE